MKKLFDHFLYSHGKDFIDWVVSLSPVQPKINDEAGIFVGHRGVFNHPKILENTFEAFNTAISVGASIEFDIQLTLDHELVVHHDPDLTRLFGIDERIDQLSLKEIQQKAPLIPSLNEVLEEYRGKVDKFFIEEKSFLPKSKLQQSIHSLKRILTQHNLISETVLIAQSAPGLIAYEEIFPEIEKAFIYMLNKNVALQLMDSHPQFGIMGWYLTYDDQILQKMRAAKRVSGVGFMNQPNTMLRNLNRGVPYLFSDRVDKVLPKLQPFLPANERK